MATDPAPIQAQLAPTMAELALGLLGAALPDGSEDSPETTYLKRARARIGGNHAASFAAANAREADGPLGRVASALGLSPQERAAIGLALAVECDPMAGRCVTYLQSPVGGSRPTHGLLASILAPLAGGQSDLAALATGPAIRAGLLRMDDAGPIPERAIWLSDPMVACLSSAAVQWPGLTEQAQAINPAWPQSLADALEPVARGIEEQPGTLLVLRSLSRGDRREVAARLANSTGKTAALFDLDSTDTAGLGPFLVAANLLPVFETDVPPGEFRALPTLAGYAGPVLVCMGPEGSVGDNARATNEWHLPLPQPEERARLWREGFSDEALCVELGREHLQSAGRIAEICRYARTEAVIRGLEKPDKAALRAAIWSSEGAGLGSLAQPITDVIADDSMITTPALERELSHLVARCRAREKLTDNLGGALQARYKTGVRSLFAGPSGTGKTLAASWLAGKLMLPIYRVDLAAVSSKYIGETEKNLAALLAKAEEQDLVLLFDEADSLFGKRTDISDSNDRFANAQTNYLLQRIETFSGIVILTSNAKNRFDEAFTRRIDAIVDFNQPEVEERYALWLAHLGSAHALSGSELSRLAAFADLTGGHIRNVVLMAAVLARAKDGVIDYLLILEALRSEYRKLGLTVPSELAVARKVA
ncbi:ATP-binding protein [Parerythrobacter aestuarii]|uniref:ATP-binding protein n=1 Tax=Parerythrobacter aestuarii TaxID=3020909 RepID=UPI0024DE3857|nr:ATP-binding protein [Parerythrobacter aestuarii]